MVQKLRRIRIAISGPNASGKTTLAKAIGGKYGIPVLEEALAPVFDAQSKLIAAISQGAPKEEITRANHRWNSSFIEWIDRRRRMYEQNESFIADRWEADLLDMWLVLQVRQQGIDRLTLQILRAMEATAAILDMVILMPLAEPLTDTPNEMELSRVKSFSNRLLNSFTTTGIIFSCRNLNVLRISGALSTTEAKLEFVESVIVRHLR